MPGGLYPSASIIASWPKPNYVNPESHGNGLIVVSVLFGIVTTAVVSLRLAARILIIRSPGLDDVLIVLGLVFAILLSVLVVLVNVKYGVGHHIWDVPPSKLEHLRFVSWLSQFAVVLSQSCTKISILLFYRRLNVGALTKAFMWSIRIGIWYNVLYTIAFLLTIIFMCNPVDSYWLQLALTYHKKFKCGHEQASLPASGAFSVLSDFYATLVPLLLLKDLKMARKQKLLLYSLFALGFFVVAAGIGRTITLDILVNQTYDGTWWLWMNYIWTLVECYVAIICASAPALKPLYTRYISRTKGSHYHSNAAYANVSMGYQVREVSKKASDKLSTVEMGIMASREIDQVVVVEEEREGSGDRCQGLGLQPKLHELWRKNSETSSLRGGIPVQSMQSV